jgi:outer membrane protein TolC
MPAIGLALVGVLAITQGTTDDGTWKQRLSEAIARAVTNNPSIGEMEARIQAARQRDIQATALPDPEVEVGIQDIPPSDFSFTRDDFTMTKVTVRQTLPGAGKRAARAQAAQASVEAALEMHSDHVLRIAAEVADAFFGIAEVDARIAILERSLETLSSAASATSERYRVGRAPQADVLRANLEMTSAQEKLLGLRGDRGMRVARFLALQELPPDATVPPVPLPEIEPELPTADELQTRAASRSPAFLAAEAQLRATEDELTLARLERRPDFTPMAYYAHRASFEDLVGASVSITLPFFQPKRLDARESERKAEVSGARASVEMTRNEIQRGIAEAYADLDRARRQIELYRGSILPQAETNATATQEAYTVGQVDFLTFLRALVDRDTYRAELAARRAGAWRAVAALQTASGLPLLPDMPGHGDIHAQN